MTPRPQNPRDAGQLRDIASSNTDKSGCRPGITGKDLSMRS